MSRLQIWAATATPFGDDGRLDLSVVPRQAEHLLAAGVHGAFVSGTTGEFGALSITERRELLDAWAAARPDGLGLAAHVGANELGQATELAAHAQHLGLDFVAALAPYYGEAPTIDLVVRHLATIAAAAPETPLCYYHIPSMTGSTHRPGDVVVRAVTEIPTLASVKFTDDDLLEYDRIRSEHPGLQVYFGRDELLPAALSFGAEAVIGSLYNGWAPVAHEVTDAFDQGEYDRALALHRPFRMIAAVAGDHGGLGFVKELLNTLTPDCGPARSPWGPLAPADRAAVEGLSAALRAEVAGLGERGSATAGRAST